MNGLARIGTFENGKEEWSLCGGLGWGMWSGMEWLLEPEV